jgi:hypothetical protein
LFSFWQVLLQLARLRVLGSFERQSVTIIPFMKCQNLEAVWLESHEEISNYYFTCLFELPAMQLVKLENLAIIKDLADHPPSKPVMLGGDCFNSGEFCPSGNSGRTPGAGLLRALKCQLHTFFEMPKFGSCLA